MAKNAFDQIASGQGVATFPISGVTGTSGINPSYAVDAIGSSSGLMGAVGNLYTTASSGTALAGGTGTEIVMAVYAIPGNALDHAGCGITIYAAGSFAANGQSKRVTIHYNPTAATVGSAVNGGSIIADTGVVSGTNGSGASWSLYASVYKYGISGSNTQVGIHEFAQVGVPGVAPGTLSPVTPTALTGVESGAILVALCGVTPLTAGDISFAVYSVQGFN